MNGCFHVSSGASGGPVSPLQGLGVASSKSGGRVCLINKRRVQTKSFVLFDLNNSPVMDGDQDGPKSEGRDLVTDHVQPRGQGLRVPQCLGCGWVRLRTVHGIWL